MSTPIDGDREWQMWLDTLKAHFPALDLPPSPAVLMFPTIDEARAESARRISPLIEPGEPSTEFRVLPIHELMEDEVASYPFRERETADDDWLKVLVPLQECVAVFDENEFPPFDATGFTAKWNSVAKPVRPRGVHFGRPCLGLSFDAPDGVLRMHMTERHARWLMVSLASYLIESINRRRYQSFSSSGSPSEAESRFAGPSEP